MNNEERTDYTDHTDRTDRTDHTGFTENTDNTGRTVLALDAVSFRYPRGRRMILKDISAEFVSGRLYTLEGESGAGKSTMLNLLAGLSVPTSGRVLLNGEDIRSLGRSSGKKNAGEDSGANGRGNAPRSVNGLTLYRRNVAATVPQANLLFDGRTVLENVLYPMLLKGTDRAEAEERARGYLADVKLPEELYDRFPGECSGGEQKRAAFARAMALDNPVVLADEPTANLDKGTSAIVSEILRLLAAERGKLVLAVTHEEAIPAVADERLFLRAGVIEKD